MYKTFLRSARNFEEFHKNPKIEQETDLTYSEAREACHVFNANRTDRQIEEGTKMELTEQ